MHALPSKKQHALLEFIDTFIAENNYAPSYREVMSALDYKSVSTVANHINGLIERGWLVKRDNEKRSVEVVYKVGKTVQENSPTPSLALTSEPQKPKERVSEEELVRRLNKARTKVEVGANYIHFKGGSYRVIDLAIKTEDDEVCVIYTATYGEGITFTRSLKEWLDQVDVDGALIGRFNKTS